MGNSASDLPDYYGEYVGSWGNEDQAFFVHFLPGGMIVTQKGTVKSRGAVKKSRGSIKEMTRDFYRTAMGEYALGDLQEGGTAMSVSGIRVTKDPKYTKTSYGLTETQMEALGVEPRSARRPQLVD